ncbi:MAG: cytochrome b [Rhodothalassiaceae bacterium]
MSAMRSSSDRWGSGAMAFHWIVALLVIGQWGLGYVMHEFVENLEDKYVLYQLHKSIGFTLFLIVIARILWRLSERATPQVPASATRLERLLAHATHVGLYLLLLLMPISGWISTETSKLDIPTIIFGLFTLPDPFGPNETLHELFEEVHEILAFLLVILLVLHIGAALRHHFLLKDDVLRRMLPVRMQ